MWKEKLQAFCVALEMENIPELLDRATVGDFSRIGAVMSSRIKEIAAAQNTSTNSAIVPCATCGGACRIGGDDKEGTHYYEPLLPARQYGA